MSGYYYLIGTIIVIAATNGVCIKLNGGTLPAYLYVLNCVLPFAVPLAMWLAFALPMRLKRIWDRRAALPAVLAEVEDKVLAHRLSLTRKLDAAVTRGFFGKISEDRRAQVWAEFFKTNRINVQRFPEVLPHAQYVLANIAQVDTATGFDPNTIPEDGHEFEYWVARSLQLYGWKTQVTVGSGDQGIDVIAKRGGKSLGIQCKLYKSNVGNKAVQEAFAGKIHYNLDDAAVLTNAQFTGSAKKLASSTGTLLLSQYDIPSLHEKLEGY